MPLVDYEAVVLDLEQLIRSKRSHGQRDLLDALADLRSRHRLAEGLAEKALRLYGDELHEALSRPAASRVPDRDEADAEALAPS
jgi:hypothetical protein